MTFISMHQSIVSHDAIGNDIELMTNVFAKQHKAVCYAQYGLNKSLKYIDEKKINLLAQSPQTVIVYHHSGLWEDGEKLLDGAKAQIVFKYHNITPPKFFAPYCTAYEKSCFEGRKQTERLIKKFPNAFWLADSQYNASELYGVDKQHIAVCAPFNKIERWSKAKPDEAVLKSLVLNENINALFVGRCAPNKGHLAMIEALAVYCSKYKDSRLHLWIIGKSDDALHSYNTLVHGAAAYYGLRDRVHIIGEINDSILKSYYIGSDFYLNMSEHEGFCVPVVEAQYFELPIISFSSCAVPETVGENQLLLHKNNPLVFAKAMHTLVENKELSFALGAQGRKNYESRFTETILSKRLTEIFDERFKVKL